MKFILPAQAPFSLASTVRSHGWWQLAPFAYDEAANRLIYIDHLTSGRVVRLSIREIDTQVEVELTGGPSLEDSQEITCKVNWMLELDQDFSDFYALARQEPKLQHIVETARGRVLRSPTLFEDVVKTILTTNTQWGGTKRMVQLLVDHYGEALPEDPQQKAFPTPQRLAIASEEDLRQMTRLGYRAPYVAELASQVDSGALDLEAIKASSLPTPLLRKQLLAIKGVGGYAAANLLMILGRYDFIPIDSWALKVVSHEWYGGEPISPAQVEAAFERWGQWKGLAYWFWEWSKFNQP